MARVSTQRAKGIFTAIESTLISKRARKARAAFEPLETRRLMSVNVTTYHYDNTQQGANTHETVLTTSNVNSTSFGKIASMPVDGQVYAQPLVMTNVAVPGQGTRDVVFVATERDTVYAFDAQGNNPAQGYLWKFSLLQTGETDVPETDYGTTDIIPDVGITGTPVIDPATNTLYVVGLMKEADATYTQRLYALDITTGQPKLGGPVTIAASVPGTGVGSVNGVIAFNAFRENQRPALTLANGEVYIGYASHGDQQPWHGWLLAYGAANLNLDYAYCNTPNASAGGIWMSGGGIAVDSSGNLYFSTGNGTFDVNTGGKDYGMTIQKVSSTLQPLDYFAPYNEASLSNADLDYGCSSVIILPTQSGAHPNQILSESKWGTMYLNSSDTGTMGQFTSGGPNNDLSEGNFATNLNTSNVHQTFAYWNGHAYIAGDGYAMAMFNVGGGALTASPVSKSAKVFGTAATEDGQGAGLSVSSNGTSNGIVWALDNTGFNANPSTLYAYDATDLTHLLWVSTQAPNGRDTASNAVKFTVPVVANGYVYEAGAGSVTIYGLLSTSTNTPSITVAASATPPTVTGTTTSLNVTATDPSPDLPPTYTWAATTVPAGAATPTYSTNGTNASNNPTVTFFKAGAYTFTVTARNPNSGLTATSSVNVTVTQTLSGVTISPGTASVFNGATQQFTAASVDQFGTAMASQPTFTWSVQSGGAGGTINSTGLYSAPATGSGSDTIKATSGALSATATATLVTPGSTIEVNLAGSYNKLGIVADGTTFTGGIDGVGAALSSTLLGSTQTWNGSVFTIPSPVAGNGSNNVVDATGQTITVTPGTYSTLKLLALHTNGSAASLSFVAHYSDGSAQTITQGFSDWFTPQNYPGESIAVAMVYRDSQDGTKDNRTFNLNGYSLALNSTKKLQSITLPSDVQLSIIAMDLIGVQPAGSNNAFFYPSTAGWYRAGVWQGLSGADAGNNFTSPAGSTVLISKNPTGGASIRDSYLKFNISNSAFTGSTINSVTLVFNAAALNQAGPVSFGIYGMTNTSWGSGTADPSPAPTFTGSTLIGTTQPVGAAQGSYIAYTFDLSSYITASTNGVISIELNSPAATAQETGIEIDNALTTGGVDPVIIVNYTTTRPAWLAAGSAATWNASTKTLNVTGAATIIADPGTDEPIVQASGASSVLTINPAADLKVHVGGINLTNGASAIVSSLGGSRTATNHRLLIIGTGTSPTFNIDATSSLDLADNDIDVTAGSLATINGDIVSGFANGLWNGVGGIRSSKAAGDSTDLTTLGMIRNNQQGSPAFDASNQFDGITPGASDILVRYTYYGDFNIDGHVDGTDYSLIDNAYHTSGSYTGWTNGDANYDTHIDGSDYSLIDNAFNQQSASLAAMPASVQSIIIGKSNATTMFAQPASTVSGNDLWKKKSSSTKIVTDVLK